MGLANVRCGRPSPAPGASPFAQRRAPPEVARRRFSEHAEALGQRWADAGAAGTALRAYATWATEQLRERLPRGTDQSVTALAPIVSEKTGRPEAAVAWAGAQHPVLAGMVPAMTRMTVTPTGLQTHEPANVIPPFADVICDCRALPGQDLDDVRASLDRLDGVKVVVGREAGTWSVLRTIPDDTPL